jgi:hypothetical protein
VIAPPDLLLAELLSSWAFQHLQEDSVVVVADDTNAAQVWADENLRVRVMEGVIRTPADGILPGTIHIPWVTRACRFCQRRTKCGAVRAFAEYPFSPGPCTNPRGFSAHDFLW